MDADTEDRDETYWEAVERIKDNALRTTLGWADFMHRTELLDQQQTSDLLQALAAGNDTQKLLLWLDDLLDTYAHNKAESQNENPVQFKPTYRPVDVSNLAAKLCGIPQELESRVAAARGIPVERKP